MPQSTPLETLIVAIPETAGSALYGMVDVLSATGSVWHTLTRTPTDAPPFRVRIVSPSRDPFRCGYGIPVEPHAAIDEIVRADLVIVPELWLGPDEHLKGRYPALRDWMRARHADGAHLYSACSGAVLLAETGLLDGRDATSHWGYQELFRREYPQVRFHPEPNLCFADATGRIVTAGGTTSWHDLALHIIARHASPGEALRIAQVYLLKWHDEGQLPYEPLVRAGSHGDALVRTCERWLAQHGCEPGAVAGVVAHARVPERTLKRRFKAATGMAIIDYVQNVRIEAAKRRLETTDEPADEVGYAVGYEDPSFFRRLFKRKTGVTPARYRRVFQPVQRASPIAGRRRA
ncbi:AraC family transcriptional regulator [Luteitalea sp. TBR-22]|uniref:GlxA family transcriptional regulator n=1 Tax=Luteitalea sp. TBR-22 TaxID=2802971 RepID=UPI001AF9E62D|nr:helix-turn-helix domain-containing protein [Luteitalea sp. TBR-22]BCS30948.1 AraC family transcriptional regulator [Luteitalea sp. TBR-22]